MTELEVISPYNPLNIPNVALSLALEVLEQKSHSLPPTDPFTGVGIYLLYYMGDFPLYKPLADINKRKSDDPKVPIYVGKGERKGKRKGIVFTPSDQRAIWNRLALHKKSIELANNLDIKDFRCRYLVVEDAFISLAESVLISVFSPLWNQVVEGFGNNPTGEPRKEQAQSKWEVLHPGRKRGQGVAREAEHDLIAAVEAHLLTKDQERHDTELERIRKRIKKYDLA